MELPQVPDRSRAHAISALRAEVLQRIQQTQEGRGQAQGREVLDLGVVHGAGGFRLQQLHLTRAQQAGHGRRVAVQARRGVALLGVDLGELLSPGDGIPALG